MTIDSFASALREAISRQRPSTAPMKEGAFELRHVIKPAWSLAVRHPDVHVSVHPCPPREKCLDGCKGTAADPAKRRCGCPDCWHDSKPWSVVRAYGMKHNFDLVARDRQGRSMAVEVKRLSFKNGTAPNGEFQRFVGQCTLAAARHNTVLGVCCLVGHAGRKLAPAEKRLEKQLERALARRLKAISVHILVLHAAPRAG